MTTEAKALPKIHYYGEATSLCSPLNKEYKNISSQLEFFVCNVQNLRERNRIKNPRSILYSL